MSYTIIKNLSVQKDGVHMVSASNNVYPRHYYKEVNLYLTVMLLDQGKDAVDTYILHQYWSGMWQGGSNKYAKVVDRFRKEHPEYAWGDVGEQVGLNKWGDHSYKYSYTQLDELLLSYYKGEQCQH